MDEDLTITGSSEGISIHSGFPNPALDSHRKLGPALDLNQLLIHKPSSTYLFRIAGHNWSDQGVYDGDIAIIDRSTISKPNDLIVTWVEDNFTLLRRQQLDSTDQAWGVVTALIHQFDRNS